MTRPLVCATTAVMLLTNGLLFAQATATLTGRVVDEVDAVLPGVIVTVTNTATGALRTTLTNEAGLYSVPALDPGTYSVRVELSGFAPAERREINLLTGSTATVDLRLSIGAIQETLTVAGGAPIVDTTKAVLSGSIRAQEVVQLPMLNRSLGTLMTLLPGVREGQAPSATRTTANYVSIGGDGGRSSVMVVDGLDNKEDQCSGGLISYTLEGVEEFKVMTSGFGPEYRGSAAIVLATKSGTNQWHGSAFGFGRNEKLVATDYFSKPENGGPGEQPFRRAQVGGSFGGPIVRDNAWFFGAYERVNQTFNLARPPSVIQELNQLIPLNIAVSVSPSIEQPSHDNLSQFKVNLQPWSNHSFFGRYAGQYLANDNTILPTWADVEGYRYAQLYHQKTWIASTGWNAIVSPRIVNQLRAGYTYYNQLALYPPSDGFDCVNRVTALDYLCTQMNLRFPSVQTASVPQWSPGRDSGNTKIQLKNDLSIQLGRHALKLGGDYISLPVFGGYCDQCQLNAIFWFDNPSVIANNTNGRYPQGFRTPGAVRSINTVTPGRVHADYTGVDVWAMGLYAQDDFRVSRNVTLNLGLRYDWFDYLSLDQYSNNRTAKVLTAIGHQYAGYPTLHPDMAPTVGVAWDLDGDGTDVVRGSFSMAYVSATSNSSYFVNILSKPLLSVTQTRVNTAVGVGQLADFVYGVSPLPKGMAATEFLPGQGTTANVWDPDLKDPVFYHWHAGYSHAFGQQTNMAVDYTHLLGRRLYRIVDLNPLLPDPANPSGPRVRKLAADLQRVYGDANLMGSVPMYTSIGESAYDGLDVHFEHRFPRSAFQVNYTLAWARGFGGTADPHTAVVAAPQRPTGDTSSFFDEEEWGPTLYDERHRVSVAGVFELPWGVSVAPAITAATARPYSLFSGIHPAYTLYSPTGVYLLDANGNAVGPNSARGKALINANARVGRNLRLGGQQTITLFAEFYNILNRANFGNQYGSFRGSPTYQRPINYLGGSGATSNIPVSFQVQFGARFAF